MSGLQSEAPVMYWTSVEQLCWMIAHLAAVRGYCPRGALRVMYADLFPGDDVFRPGPMSKRKPCSIGKYSTRRLGEDLRDLAQMGIIERRDARVVVTDWEQLHRIALKARAA